jgi:hypothetical protein
MHIQVDQVSTAFKVQTCQSTAHGEVSWMVVLELVLCRLIGSCLDGRWALALATHCTGGWRTRGGQGRAAGQRDVGVAARCHASRLLRVARSGIGITGLGSWSASDGGWVAILGAWILAG